MKNSPEDCQRAGKMLNAITIADSDAPARAVTNLKSIKQEIMNESITQ